MLLLKLMFLSSSEERLKMKGHLIFSFDRENER